MPAMEGLRSSHNFLKALCYFQDVIVAGKHPQLRKEEFCILLSLLLY